MSHHRRGSSPESQHPAQQQQLPSTDAADSQANAESAAAASGEWSPLAMANTAGNAVSLAGDVPVSSFSTAYRLSAQMLGGLARTSVVWLNHLLRVFAPVYRMPLRAFRPVQMRPFDNLKQRAWALAVRQGKIKPDEAAGGGKKVVSPAAAATASTGQQQQQRYDRIGAFRAMRTVYASEGLLSLVHHLSPALLANVVVGSVMFSSYQAVIEAEHALRQQRPHSLLAALFTPRQQQQDGQAATAASVSSASLVMPPVSYSGIVLAGAVSGCCQSLFLTPIQAVNTHYEHHHYLHTMQRHPSAKDYATSLRPSHHASFRQLWHSEGMAGVMRGWQLTAVRDTVGMAAFFVTFQLVKSVLVQAEGFHRQRRQKLTDETFVHRELGWSPTHIWNSCSIVLAGIAAGLSYRLLTHPFVILQHRRDRDYLIRLNDHQRLSSTRVPLLCFAHNATEGTAGQRPAYRELLELYRKQGLRLVDGSALSLPHSLSSVLNRLTLLFSPSVVGLLTYELTKMHQAEDAHQH